MSTILLSLAKFTHSICIPFKRQVHATCMVCDTVYESINYVYTYVFILYVSLPNIASYIACIAGDNLWKQSRIDIIM